MYLYNKFKPPFEIVAQKFLSKIKYGELSVTFHLDLFNHLRY